MKIELPEMKYLIYSEFIILIILLLYIIYKTKYDKNFWERYPFIQKTLIITNSLNQIFNQQCKSPNCSITQFNLNGSIQTKPQIINEINGNQNGAQNSNQMKNLSENRNGGLGEYLKNDGEFTISHQCEQKVIYRKKKFLIRNGNVVLKLEDWIDKQ